ncbi:hypothetical protein DCS_04010 [Drechmeria coniospora]|uniref:Secreted protein n=1 Tax=Drechmeria coniospora TaxID=98403 RepID=A0A151GIQ2_DRECN|nr:hypothetical protein DCS_04010 [Drechmeria coniospora]KYK57003.1 hypothetical protein DCS_04010 [Drechmeria coniospora]
MYPYHSAPFISILACFLEADSATHVATAAEPSTVPTMAPDGHRHHAHAEPNEPDQRSLPERPTACGKQNPLKPASPPSLAVTSPRIGRPPYPSVPNPPRRRRIRLARLASHRPRRLLFSTPHLVRLRTHEYCLLAPTLLSALAENDDSERNRDRVCVCVCSLFYPPAPKARASTSASAFASSHLSLALRTVTPSRQDIPHTAPLALRFATPSPFVPTQPPPAFSRHADLTNTIDPTF